MHFLKFSLLSVLLALPSVALAAPPPSVTGLEVNMSDNALVVSWDKVDAADIAFYRVYYSSQSILGNNGAYDDFGQTEGPKARYTFESLPVGEKLYIGVLAVSMQGEESQAFAEEISVDLPQGFADPSSSTDDVPALSPPATDPFGTPPAPAPAPFPEPGGTGQAPDFSTMGGGPPPDFSAFPTTPDGMPDLNAFPTTPDGLPDFSQMPLFPSPDGTGAAPDFGTMGGAPGGPPDANQPPFPVPTDLGEAPNFGTPPGPSPFGGLGTVPPPTGNNGSGTEPPTLPIPAPAPTTNTEGNGEPARLTLPDAQPATPGPSTVPPPPVPLGPAQDAQGQRALGQATNTGTDSDQFGNRLHLLAAEALSPTEVALTFSHLIDIQPEDAPQAFKIGTSDGGELRITRLVILGMDVTLETVQQERDKVYIVQLDDPLQSDKGFPLDQTDRTAFFTGHTDGKDPAPAPAAAQAGVGTINAPADITGYRLRASALPGGLFAVSARWDARDVAGGLSFYVVRQSYDRGLTFSEPQLVPAGVGGVELQGIQGGEFGLAVQTMNQHGFTSQGVFESISLPLPGETRPPVASVVTPPPAPTPPLPQPEPKPTPPPPAPSSSDDTGAPSPAKPHGAKNLAQTGSAFVMITMAAGGAIVGWRRSRK